MRIGELAEQTGIGVETVRFYEREGLLPAPPRSANSYRDYPADSPARLQFIQRAKRLGFSLAEVRELLSLNAAHGPRAEVKALAAHKLAEIDTRITDLQRMRTTLADLIRQCSGTGPVDGCPIIAALAREPAGPDQS